MLKELEEVVRGRQPKRSQKGQKISLLAPVDGLILLHGVGFGYTARTAKAFVAV